MAWRIADSFFVREGHTVRIRFWWGDPGEDHGPQWAMGHGTGARLMTERVGKHARCDIGVIRHNDPAEYSCAPGSRLDYVYYADIRNEGPSDCVFVLEGGGVV